MLFFPTSTEFQPFQLVTHMFMHASMGHLFFNMFGLYIFGPFVERTIGVKKFFQLYFIAGFGAMLLHLGVDFLQYGQVIYHPDFVGIPMLGASGALMGVVAAFATLFPNMRVQLLIPPVSMKAKYMALLFIGLDLFLGLSGSNSGVAHFAHVGGALFGFLFIRLFGSNDFRIN